MYQVDLFKEVYGSPQGRRQLEAVVYYLRERGTRATGEVTRQVLGCVMREQRVEELMWTEGQRLRAEGRRVGRVEGVAEGMANAVLMILAARGVRMGDKSRQRILGCTDLATLDRWLKRALHADRLSEVLDDPETSSHPGTRKRTARVKKAVHS
ncbi:MAG TPA: hypothetical protein VEU33_28980 [Archangium sp.]|nr:hypothetical protein [Archangium sp.]